MSPEAQMKILNLCKGKTIAQAEKRLRVTETFYQQRMLATRIGLATLKIGD